VHTAGVLCIYSIQHQSWTITAFILLRYEVAALSRHIGIGRTEKRICPYDQKVSILAITDNVIGHSLLNCSPTDADFYIFDLHYITTTIQFESDETT